MKQVPLAYLDIIERLYKHSFNGMLKTERVRYILACHIHFSRDKIKGIIGELYEMDLIDYKMSWIIIKWRPDK